MEFSIDYFWLCAIRFFLWNFFFYIIVWIIFRRFFKTRKILKTFIIWLLLWGLFCIYAVTFQYMMEMIDNNCYTFVYLGYEYPSRLWWFMLYWVDPRHNECPSTYLWEQQVCNYLFGWPISDVFEKSWYSCDYENYPEFLDPGYMAWKFEIYENNKHLSHREFVREFGVWIAQDRPIYMMIVHGGGYKKKPKSYDFSFDDPTFYYWW